VVDTTNDDRSRGLRKPRPRDEADGMAGDNDVISGGGDDKDAMGMGEGDLRGYGGGRGIGDGGDVRTG
jgi:hypothetical protein